MLQVGGEQEAVTDPAPAEGVEAVHESVQPVPREIAAGCDALQVSGILLNVTPLVVFARELLPITSVTVAITVCEVPLETAKLVCSDPAWPISRAMFWIGHVSKKSKTTGGGEGLFGGVGCWNEMLETPSTLAWICVSPGLTACAVAWLVAKL